MRSRPGQRGQAATDYVALLAVLAVLLASAAAVAAAGAPGVTNAVLAQLRRALCIVTGSPCVAERARPCVVSASQDHRHLAAHVVLVRLDDDHVLLREALSDGTVRLTVVEHSGVGVQAGIGAHGRVRVGARTLRVGASARLALLGAFGDGRVFHARNRREADRIVRAVLRREVPIALDRPYRIVRGLFGGDGPPPDEVYFDGGLKALGEAGVGNLLSSADAQGVAAVALGARRDRRTGEVTVYLSAERGGEALASAAVGAGAGALRGEVVLGLTYDRRRRPVALSLLASGAVGAGGGLPPPLAALLGRDGDGSTARGVGPARVPTDGRRWELDAQLDLTDPDIAAAWDAYRRAPGSLAAIRALGARLRSRARLDTRTYRTSSTGRGVAGGAAAGAGVGAEIERTLERSELTAAATRPPGGVWEPRTDCLRSRA